ncbi:MAG TPA: TIGR03086 family metal-binding protein [Acidimicrobiales bacterium]|nr:TIGR03086 family metal-binding protein [Acidimicrobiales bacterium]
MTPAPGGPAGAPGPVALHDAALDSTAAVVARVRPDQLGLPTPCALWDVRALIGHLVEANELFAVAAGSEPAVLPADDPLAAYPASTEAVRRAWHQPGVLDRHVRLPFGALPGAVAVRMHFVDHLVHGWDLAVATGQDATLDPVLASAAHDEMTTALAGVPRGPDVAGGPFAPPVPWPDDAPVHERLVAFLGRRPPAPAPPP